MTSTATMSHRAAILLGKGFREADKWASTCGIDKIHDACEAAFHDRRVDYVAKRVWDADPAADVEEIVRKGINRICTVTFSWGNGRWLMRFGELLNKHGLEIDLACLIDPVPYVVGRWFSQACLPTGRPFVLPPNVRTYATWRTVNWRNITDPWGRHVVPADGAVSRCELRKAFGSPAALKKYKPLGTALVDEGETVHTNIDESPIVRDDIMRLLQAEVDRA